MGRKKLSEEGSKRVNLDIPAEDYQDIVLSAKLSGKKVSAYMRDVLSMVTDIHKNRRDVVVIDATDGILKKLNINILYFELIYDDYIDPTMREAMAAKNQGNIALTKEGAALNSTIAGIPTEDRDDNVKLCELLNLSEDSQLKFWSKLEIYSSSDLKKNEKEYLHPTKITSVLPNENSNVPEQITLTP